jgi:hypothetical protein
MRGPPAGKRLKQAPQIHRFGRIAGTSEIEIGLGIAIDSAVIKEVRKALVLTVADSDPDSGFEKGRRHHQPGASGDGCGRP